MVKLFDLALLAIAVACVHHYTGHACIALAVGCSLLYLKDHK